MQAYWGVNWKNGMKINSHHFIQERAFMAFMNSLSASKHLSDYNYGLIHLPGYDNLSYKIYNNRLSIESCLGISRGGFIFFINQESNQNIVSLSLDEIRAECNPDDYVQVYLAIHPGQVHEFGTIDSESFPTNHPSASYNYKLVYHIHTQDNKPADFNKLLPISRLIIKQDGIEEDEAYIPPCVTIRANEALYKIHSDLQTINFSLAKNNSLILQKLSDNAHQSLIKTNIKNLADKMVFFLAEHLDSFSSQLVDEDPLQTFLFYRKINRVINASLANMQNRGEMLSQMAAWSGLAGDSFLSAINEITSHEFSHNELVKCFNVIKHFASIIDKMFAKINSINI